MRTPLHLALLLTLATAATPQQGTLDPWPPGQGINGSIGEDAAVVRTPYLQGFGEEAHVIGVALDFTVEESGPHHLEMWSWFFDSYLVLLDEGGDVLAEDDDGLLRPHARVGAVELEAGRTYRVLLCSVPGGWGPFEAALFQGAPPERDDEALARIEGGRALAIVDHLRSEGTTDPELFARLASRVGVRLRALGFPEEARPLLEEAAGWLRANLGADDEETLRNQAAIARTLAVLGELDAANRAFADACTRAARVLVPTPLWTVEAIEDWGLLLLELGAIDAAIERFEVALQWRDSTLPPDAPTLIAAERLASLLLSQSRYAAGIERAERAMALRELLRPQDPVAIPLLYDLARAHLRMGQAEAAETLFARGLEWLKEHMGEELDQIADATEALAIARSGAGRIDEAAPLFDEARRLREASLGPAHPSVAVGLGKRAEAEIAEGRHEAAQAHLEEALDLARAADDPARRARSRLLLLLADLFYRRDETERALPLQEETLEVLDSIEEPEPSDLETRISAHHTLGRCLFELRRLSEARAELERARELAERGLEARDPLVASVLSRFSSLARHEGRLLEAAQAAGRVVAIREGAFGAESLEAADARRSLGLVRLERGQYEEALADFGRERAVLEAHAAADAEDLADELASASTNLATTLHKLGQVAGARRAYERALGESEAAFSPTSERVLDLLNNYAIFLFEQGFEEEGLAHMRRAAAIGEEVHGPDSREIGKLLHNLGTMAHTSGAVDEGLAMLERAQAILDPILDELDPYRALMLRNRAAILWGERQRERAFELLEEAHAIRLASLGAEHPDTAEGLGHLGTVLVSVGRLDEALERLAESHSRLAAQLGASHAATTLTLHKMASTRMLAGDAEGAWETARRALADSRAELEANLFAWNEGEQLRYLAQARGALDLFLSMTLLLEPGDAAEAGLDAVLAWKGQASRLARARRAVVSAEQETLVEELREAQARLSRLLYQREGEGLESRSARLDELRAERGRLERELSSRLDRVAIPRPASWTELREALPEGAAALSFLVVEVRAREDLEGGLTLWKSDGWPARVFAWVLRGGGEPPRMIDLGPAEELERLVRPFLEELESSRGYGRVETESHNDRLRERLWDPLAEALAGAHMVLLSPDSFLGTLPFETIQLEDGSYLLERHAFVYLADLGSLPELLAREPTRGSALLTVGGVDYGKRPREVEGQLTPYRSGFPTWRPLAGTADESLAIAGLHRQAFGEEAARVSIGSGEATEERVKELLPDRAVIHLATHGFFRPKGLPAMGERVARGGGDFESRMREPERQLTGYHPGLLSGLVLAGANAPSPEDRDEGLLTAEEVSWLDLSAAELVVLSACESGLGRPESGEGQIGLRRAFRLAGARTILSSLFEVKDVETRDLIGAFYENLWLGGMGPLEALRAAQLRMLEDNRYDYEDGRPSTWGAFVLSGDWR